MGSISDESISSREGWQVGSVSYCQNSLTICYYCYYMLCGCKGCVVVNECIVSVMLEEMRKEDQRVKYLWEVLEKFSNEDRSRFLRFVTGRRRLPAVMHVVGELVLISIYLLNTFHPQDAPRRLQGCVIRAGTFMDRHCAGWSNLALVVPAKARECVFTGVGLCVCLCVCLCHDN